MSYLLALILWIFSGCPRADRDAHYVPPKAAPARPSQRVADLPDLEWDAACECLVDAHTGKRDRP